VMAAQLLPLVAQMIVGPRKAQSFPVFWRNVRADSAIALAQIVLGVTFLAYHAWDTAHAIVLTLVRLTITKRRLLEWETAAAAAAHRSPAAAAAQDRPEDVAVLRDIRHGGRRMAAARQLPGRRRSAAGPAHVSNQHRHDALVDAGRTRSRVPDDRDADSSSRCH